MLISWDFLLHIAFELTLFFLLSIVVYKLFKSTIYPSICSYLKEMKDKWDSLVNQKQLAHESCRSLNDQINKQQHQLDTLEEKVQKWHNAIIKKQNQQANINKEIAKLLKNKKELQEANLHNIKLQKEALPKAIILAQKELQEDYKGETGAILQKRLVRRLKEQID